MQDLREIICRAGVAACIKAREISAVEESKIREEFLSALIAKELHELLIKPVRTEISYLTLYKMAGGIIDERIIELIGGFRADLVVYEQTTDEVKPHTIIEIKRFAEGGNTGMIEADLFKGDRVGFDQKYETYSGILVCETERSPLSRRQKMLTEIFDSNIIFSDPVLAYSGTWKWSFGCAKREDATEL